MEHGNLHRLCLQEVLRLYITLLWLNVSFESKTTEEKTCDVLNLLEHSFFCFSTKDEGIPNSVLGFFLPSASKSPWFLDHNDPLFCPFPWSPPVQPSTNNGKAGSSLLFGTLALSRPCLSQFAQGWPERWEWSPQSPLLGRFQAMQQARLAAKGSSDFRELLKFGIFLGDFLYSFQDYKTTANW